MRFGLGQSIFCQKEKNIYSHAVFCTFFEHIYRRVLIFNLNKMKKLLFVAFLGMSALLAHAQQWAGSTTTSDTIYRYG